MLSCLININSLIKVRVRTWFTCWKKWQLEFKPAWDVADDAVHKINTAEISATKPQLLRNMKKSLGKCNKRCRIRLNYTCRTQNNSIFWASKIENKKNQVSNKETIRKIRETFEPLTEWTVKMIKVNAERRIRTWKRWNIEKTEWSRGRKPGFLSV